MKVNHYPLFFKFIERFQPQNFLGIDRGDPFVLDLEKELSQKKQFFLVGDLIKMKINFTSAGCKTYFGIDPDELDPSMFLTLNHKEELFRHNLGRTKMMNLGQSMFISPTDPQILSSTFRFLRPNGNYGHFLIQIYFFVSEAPIKTTYILLVITEIDSFRMNKQKYHYYIGPDLSMFRYPDQELLAIGQLFSDRELEILRLISEGESSEAIAERLFLSVHTVNTHRRNILKKTGNRNTLQLVMEYKLKGVL